MLEIVVPTANPYCQCSPSLPQLRSTLLLPQLRSTLLCRQITVDHSPFDVAFMAGLNQCLRIWATYWRWFGFLADLGSLPCMSPGHHGGRFYPGSWHDLKLNQRQQLSSRSGQNPDISAPNMFVFVLHVDSFLSSIQISQDGPDPEKRPRKLQTKCSVL